MTVEQPLKEFLLRQRWFASKSQEVAEASIIEMIPVIDGQFGLAIAQVSFHPGTHELYQLPVGMRPVTDRWDDGTIGEKDGTALYDAMRNPELAKEIVRLMNANAEIDTGTGTAQFRSMGGSLGEPQEVRAMGAEQSNTSLVLDERLALKAYRKLGAGPNPELEMLRFLTEHGFEHSAALRGWYAHTGRLIDATLGIVQDFVHGSTDGWDLALQDLGDAPERFVERAAALGRVTGAMHSALASNAQDPAFAPEETSSEMLGLLTATVDEEIERVFLKLPEDNPDVGAIIGRGEEVRERLRQLTNVGSAGRVIRHHGDYHLGQVVLDQDGRWVVLDFEGEPARPLMERRRKRSPLRDVAGMLRSFAYAANASRILHGNPAPDDWEQRVRGAFLDGYTDTIDPRLLPPGQAAIERLLSVFELEKAVYELRYELDNRPDWVSIPAAGIARLLEVEERV